MSESIGALVTHDAGGKPELYALPDHDEKKKTHGKPVSDVQNVFDYWVEKTWGGKGPTPKLSDKRRRKIKRALDLYDLQTCKDAIDGIMLSDFHQGFNARGQKYLDIELILRDAEHIERFATNWAEQEDGEPW